MKTLTVITTTYNRAYCLHQVYESLLRQDCDDFVWLVMDDGSTDGTRELVRQWIDAGRIGIEYYYKPNGGMHTARNAAYEKVNTELNVIIDSDDWMADDAVGKIVRFWNKNKKDNIAGIISLNAEPGGKLIGTAMPKGVTECHYEEFWNKYRMSGDKKMIYRSVLTRSYPYPEFSGEKFYPASYKFRMIDQQYKMLIMDDVTCIVDYNSDSMSYAKTEQYRSCAKGFAHYRKEIINITHSPKEKIFMMIHYTAESKFAGNRHYVRESGHPFLATVCMPVGLVYYCFLCGKLKKDRKNA